MMAWVASVAVDHLARGAAVWRQEHRHVHGAPHGLDVVGGGGHGDADERGGACGRQRTVDIRSAHTPALGAVVPRAARISAAGEHVTPALGVIACC